jgi:hypothetical protein
LGDLSRGGQGRRVVVQQGGEAAPRPRAGPEGRRPEEGRRWRSEGSQRRGRWRPAGRENDGGGLHGTLLHDGSRNRVTH